MVAISYLPSDARERLQRYEYHGEDRSYMYKYIWRPLCVWLVERLPGWLAPNIITVGALAIVCATHTLIAYHMPKLTVTNSDYLLRNESDTGAAAIPFANEFLPPPPVYIFILAALGLATYQLLDNLDGHQARRTGTSSPLGLLMDHGCDAFNCVVGSLSIAAAISAGPTWKTWCIVVNALVMFFMHTWEEYYRGALVLPVVNAPNEGVLVAILIYLFTACVGGPHWWVDHAVTVPQRLLPQVLRQPPPDAAVAIEKMVLERVCPWLTPLGGRTVGTGGGGGGGASAHEGFSPVPFFLNLNCSAAYRANPPRPTEVLFDADPWTAAREQIVIGKLWSGHSVLQRVVLRMYGTGAEGTLRLQFNTIAVILMTLTAMLTCTGNMYEAWRAIQGMSLAERAAHGLRGRTWLQRRLPFLDACRRLLPLLVVTVMANVWFFTSQEDIFRRHPRIFCWTVGLVYTKSVIHLMVSHLCGCEFQPFRRTLIPFVLFGVHITMTYLHNLNKLRRQKILAVVPHPDSAAAMSVGGGTGTISASKTIADMLVASSTAYSTYAYDLDEELILYEFFALTVITFAHLVWNLSRQTAAVLGVPIFTVPAGKQEALRRAMAEKHAERRIANGRKQE